MPSGAKACQSCRSRQELSNEHLLAKFGFDTAENEPLKVCKKKPEVGINVRKDIGAAARPFHGRAGPVRGRGPHELGAGRSSR